MMTFFGAVLIFFGIGLTGLAFYWRSKNKILPFGKNGVLIGLVIVLGFVLLLPERFTEFEGYGVKLKAATQQATAEVQTITKLRERVEAQSATVDLVAAGAAKAKGLSEAATRIIAALEKEVADARKRTAEIEKITAWRIIEPGDLEALGTSLSKIPKSASRSVVFAYPPNEMECLYLAVQLADVFIRQKDWKLERQSRTYPGALYWGIRILGADNNETTRAIREAFKEAHIEFSTDDLPGGFQTYGHRSLPTDTTILIGSKKPPMAHKRESLDRRPGAQSLLHLLRTRVPVPPPAVIKNVDRHFLL